MNVNAQVCDENTEIMGRIVGGELSSLSKGIGTYWELKSEDAILFITDDIGDPIQTLSCLIHLQQAGFLDNAQAIIFGPFKGVDANQKSSRGGKRDNAQVRRDVAMCTLNIFILHFDSNTFQQKF